MLHRVEEEVRLTHVRRRRPHLSVVREHYLRSDIICKVEKCTVCHQQIRSVHSEGTLSSKSLHYAVPDVPALSKFLEVFEHPSLTGCILLQTVLTHVRTRVGRQSYHRTKALIGHPSKNCVMFSNEYHYETFASRGKQETLEEWQERMVHIAALWYTNHLALANMDTLVVIVTPNPQHYSRFSSERTNGLHIMSLEGYLKCFWPTLTEVQLLLHSLTENIMEAKSTASVTRNHYANYLSANTIKDKLIKGSLYSGRLQVSNYHSRDEAFITPHLGSETYSFDSAIGSDIFIAGSVHRNRAIHGDVVAVELLPRSNWCSRNNALPPQDGSQHAPDTTSTIGRSGTAIMRTGVVVGIVEQSERMYVASFDESSGSHQQGGKSEKVLVFPYNIKIPKIRISTRQTEELRKHRIVVHIDSWPADSQYPNGHFVRNIGLIGDLETETAVILMEHQLSAEPFSRAVLAELHTLSISHSWKVNEAEVANKRRRDLRDTHFIVSIDPKGCEDVDDALSVRELHDGRKELGVHIADVSHFVRSGTLTDQDAARRCTSIYLADRRYDMLPPMLSANLCSLLSAVDRYAVSVLWTLDASYQVKEVWYGRTVIRSRYKLAYESAQALLDGAPYEDIVTEIDELQDSIIPLSEDDKKLRVEELRHVISLLVVIARVIKERRGGLKLEGVEVRVELDVKDKNKVLDLIPKQSLEVHEIIAECMIFANHWVAKKIESSYPTKSLLRCHPPPPPERLAKLVACAKRRGFSLATQSNKALSCSLDACFDPEDPDFNQVLRFLATQAMLQAQYFSTGALPPEKYQHYGLDLDLYTHFTSPIRRYADLVVHRLLLAAMGDISTESDPLPTSTTLQEMATHMNKKHRSAQLAQIASMDLFQAIYFASKHVGSKTWRNGRHEVDGVVMGLRANGIIIFSPRFGIRGPVYLRDKQGLVAQPDPAAPDQIIFDTGMVTQTDEAVSVSYASGGSYTIHMLDHVRVHVTSRVSHAHGHSLSLHLLQCGPVLPSLGVLPPLSRESTVKDITELVKVVRDRSGDSDQMVSGSSFKTECWNEYRQSCADKSLYCVIQKVQRLALKPDLP